jgi:carbonic anhydrase
MIKKFTVVLATAGALLTTTAAFADYQVNCATGTYYFDGACAKPTPEQGLELLLNGNQQYAKGELEHLVKFSKSSERTEVAAGQKPFAVVLTCSDSRVPPEILFNKGLGEIFTVRVAGNIVAPHELGSIEYALEHLHANLIVVLGHERCGAVKSTYDAYPETGEGNIGSLLVDIKPAVDAVLNGQPKPATATEQAAQVEECVVENIKKVSESLEAKSTVIKDLVEKNEIKIVRAKYDLDNGLVKVISE